MPVTIHLIGNAHIDPVWLWDWREGLNEGLATCRAMVDLLNEFPEARFIRGEAAIYEHVERHDPALFAAIRRLVAAGRWEVVGGTYIQPDANLPGTELLLRQYVRGKRYFRDKFGAEVTAAWSADTFGYPAGFPAILHAAGIQSIACTRPTDAVYRLAKPAFWWRAPGGIRILGYRPANSASYCIGRDEMPGRLDQSLAEAAASGLENVACFYGLGNHGGGPTRRHLWAIRDWAAHHPEVRVQHSGLHQMFAALRLESKARGSSYLPTVEGELNFCLRGCYASVAKFKFLYRRAESQLLRAERTAAAVSTLTRRPSRALGREWDDLLFNSFHDILPGSSIERAYDDQLAQTGGVCSAAQHVEAHALVDLAREIDTCPNGWNVAQDAPRPVPVLIWNSHPRLVRTHVEIEVAMDYRPLWAYQERPSTVPVAVTGENGRVIAHQVITEEHDFMRQTPWRCRLVVALELPPLGWRVVQVGLAPDKATAPGRPSPVKAISRVAVTNGILRLTADKKSSAVRFLLKGRTWLAGGLQVRVYEDPWGSWGGMNEETESCHLLTVRETWRIEATRVLEAGPLRTALWVRFAGKHSRLDLTFLLTRGVRHMTVRARVLWNERSARLRIVLPAGGPAEYDVPGGSTRRGPCGEVPGGRWVRAGRGRNRVGFASDSLYGFATTADEFLATIVRASRYASDRVSTTTERPWEPAVDAGELRFSFRLTADGRSLPELAADLEDAPVVMPVPAHAGPLGATGSIMDDFPPGFRLLAFHGCARDKICLRLQNMTKTTRQASMSWLGTHLGLGPVRGQEIATWQLSSITGGWRAVRLAATA